MECKERQGSATRGVPVAVQTDVPVVVPFRQVQYLLD